MSSSTCDSGNASLGILRQVFRANKPVGFRVRNCSSSGHASSMSASIWSRTDVCTCLHVYSAFIHRSRVRSAGRLLAVLNMDHTERTSLLFEVD
ncbi:uncharacterized protein LAJ45_10149 [Morchella importuna]|uniref:uncharacterized protein n=1 Tax=Morchella importuna TaxID=1174673 RepID=UPI001E8EF23D|nr:uncharacterized protein LAJ45_10149 [Morchella importuna]KAH8145825.1 hypothetical protein LAJ45_10149 [Morchella importuna]